MNREYVEDVLMKIGIPARVKGFKYIVDAVMLLDEEEWKYPKYTALYYSIAKMNNSTASRTERAIRHAFGIARSSRGDYDMAEHYIGFINCENSNSIASLYRMIKKEITEMENKQQEMEKTQKNCYLTLTEEQLSEIVKQAIQAAGTVLNGKEQMIHRI